jgi:hypothetical protein
MGGEGAGERGWEGGEGLCIGRGARGVVYREGASEMSVRWNMGAWGVEMR